MIELQLNITAEEALQRIDSFIDEYKAFWRFSYTGERSFLGRIEGDRFFVFRKIDGRNSFLPTLAGVVMEADSGCRIKADFKPRSFLHSSVSNSFLNFFRIIWFVMCVFFLLIGLLMFYMGSITSMLEAENILLLIVPLGMMIFGFVFFSFGSKFQKKEKRILIEAFDDLFDDVRQKTRWSQGEVTV